jgi:DNA mismatch repair ATPase MutS
LVFGFCQVGNFYNLWDIDADVGLDARLGLNLSGVRKANMWKVGIPTFAFPKWLVRFVELGHTVARVVQVI